MRTLAFISVSILALALGGCNAAREVKRESPSRPVLVAHIHYAPLSAAATLPAVVKPRIEADLGFRIGGKIKERLVDRGAVVKAGDTLASLDDESRCNSNRPRPSRRRPRRRSIRLRQKLRA